MRILRGMNSLVVQCIMLNIVVSCDAMILHNQLSSDVSHGSLRDAIINDPWSVYDQCSALKTKFLRELHEQHIFDHKHMSPSQAVQTFEEMCRMFEAENPIFLLGESDAEAKNYGVDMKTSVVQEAQKKYEDLIAGATMKANLQQGSVVYTNFGARKYFSDLRALSKMLVCFPLSVLAIHSVGDLDRCSTKYKDMKFGSREVFSHEVWYELSDDLAPELRSEIVDEVTQYFDPHILDDYVREDVLLRLAQKKQMIRWLRNEFPHATTSLFIHHNIESYLCYLAGHGMMLPNVLVSSDSYDNGIDQMSKHYKLLALITLLYNKDASNLLLHYEHNRPMVASYSIESAGINVVQEPIMRLNQIPLS